MARLRGDCCACDAAGQLATSEGDRVHGGKNEQEGSEI